jgi:hypothetical protein
MKRYLYYAILINANGIEIAWNDRAFNKTDFINSEYMQKLIADGWKIKSCYKHKSESKNRKYQPSLAFVDMGQLSR